MIVEEVPTYIGTQDHGKISAWHAVSHSDVMANHMIGVLILICAVVIVIALVGLVVGGRWRERALALSTMLAALGPLLGLVSATHDITNGLIDMANSPPASDVSVILMELMAASLCLFVGAVAGVIGVVVRTVLKIVSASGAKSAA